MACCRRLGNFRAVNARRLAIYVALLIVLNMLRKADERRAAELGDDPRPAIDASQWTGMR